MAAISVIIPAYNAAPTLAEAVESCLAQEGIDLEVVVVDDGSTDQTAEVARGFGGRVRLESGPNRGANAARNRGIALAKGPLVQFLDADDLLLPDKLNRQAAVLEKGAADIVFSDYKVIEPDGESSSVQGIPEEGLRDPVCMLLHHRLQTSAPLHWKRNLESVGGFTPDLKASQERDLHLRLAMAGFRFEKLPGVYHIVRKQRESISSDYVKVLRQRQHWVLPAYAKLEEEGKLTDERRRAFSGIMSLSGRELIQLGEFGLGKTYLNHAAAMHPGHYLDDWSGMRRLAYRALGPVWAEKLLALKKGME